MCSHVSQQFHVIQVQQPVRIVDHQCLAVTEINKTAHLLLEAVYVMLNGLLGHHGTHIASAGGITDHRSSSTDQSDGLVACHLHSLHQAQCHEMSHMKAVCGRIKADVEGSLSVIDQVLDLLFICQLCQ